MRDDDQQLRLQQFWGTAIFSLGALWGFANLVYCPVAALTSIIGSSWFEVFIIFAGGLLTFFASIGAFYRRRLASRLLLAGGIVLLLSAVAGQVSMGDNTRGPANLLLLFLAGLVAIALGVFGEITERKGWPALSGTL
jgi:hypothetical protein